MRKRKTILSKKLAPKTVTGVPKFFGVLNDPLGNEIERQFMEKEEADQCRVDRFWGQDKDLYDRELENIAMGIEDEESLQNERQYEQIELHRHWDEEFHRMQWNENRNIAADREQERNYHLHLVTTSQSSDEVINAVWNRKDSLNDSDPLNLHKPPAMAEQEQHQHLNGVKDPSVVSSPSMIGPSSLDAIHMSVHLDGLQRSRAIVDKASFEFKQTLRRINTQSEEENDAVEPFKQKPFSAALLKKKKKALHQQLKQRTLSDSISTDHGNKDLTGTASNSLDTLPSSIVSFEATPAHIPSIHGHQQYKWDQEAMLRAAFTLLDQSNRDVLQLGDVAALSFNPQVHDILRYTVFWYFIKKRQWEFFASLFIAGSPNTQNSGASRQQSRRGYNELEPIRGDEIGSRYNTATGKDGRYLTYEMWLMAAEGVARQPNVPLRWIRTQEEHLYFESSDPDAGVSGPITSESKSPLSIIGLPERESRISRTLEEGDCIWALHQGGCLWLPAVIIKIHRHNPSQPFSYDLWFPLSERDLQRARSMTTARHLLALPSQRNAAPNNIVGGNSLAYKSLDTLSSAKPAQPIAPKPLNDERSVCAYAFDLSDSSGAGIVPLKHLVKCMQSIEFSKIVATSLPLRTIFTNSSGNKNDVPTQTSGLSAMEIPSLLPVFIDTFSAPPEEEEEEKVSSMTEGADSVEYSKDDFESHSSMGKRKGSVSAPDWISKLDFLEFCQAVIDIKKYSVASS